MTDSHGTIAATDPQIAVLIERELERQNTTIQLIASENFASRAADVKAEAHALCKRFPPY